MYAGTKLIRRSCTQGLGSGLCDFAQVVPFSCPFEVGLWLCCVWFISAINAWISWPRAECGVAYLSWAFRTSPVASLLVEAGELPLELRRQKLCLQYICKLWSNPWNPTFDSVLGTGFQRLFEARPNTIPTLGIRLNQTIVYWQSAPVPFWLFRACKVFKIETSHTLILQRFYVVCIV